MRARAWALTLTSCCLFALSAHGCKRAELKPEGAAVEVGAGAPPSPNCRSLGPIVGYSGGALGAHLSNEALAEHATNDLRNKAGMKGANYVSFGQPQFGVTGSKEGTANNSATVSGIAYQCPEAELVPAGAAGFEFGISSTDAEKICVDAGFGYGAHEQPGYFTCDGVPTPVGIQSDVLLRFCEGRLCWIRVSGGPVSGVWFDTYLELKNVLRRKYGIPKKSTVVLPTNCARNAIQPCLRDGSAHVMMQWSWSSRLIELAMDNSGGEPAIRLIYKANLDTDSAKSDGL